MFVLLMSEKMEPFYQNIASFPTIIFTVLLLVVIFYWAIAVLGLVEIDVLDFDLDLNDADINSPDKTQLNNVDALAGLMLRFGLHGVPVTIVISIIALLGWFICYFLVYFTFSFVPVEIFQWVLGLFIFLISLFVAMLLTGFIIKPIRPLFKQVEQNTIKKIIGQIAIVRTSVVDNTFGEAILQDGGAGLLLKVRSTGNKQYFKGDKVVILEYIEEISAYRVISEAEFSG